MPILEPGRNCWRVEPFERLAFLIDGEACFGAMRRALAAARHSIDVLAWDIDSRMRLVPGPAGDGLPEPFGPFLDALARRRRGLRVRLLAWDFAMLYAFEREWRPTVKLGRRTHRRIEFALDGAHPFSASHHQKLVVIDDRVAFVGGLDPTRARWDTPAHAPRDPRRRYADGRPYAPFHDVHAVVEGAAARALGELARRRWRDAVGAGAEAPPPREDSPWPEGLEPDLAGGRVAIARTAPRYGGRPGSTEIRDLLLDGIAAARRAIYVEAQYFTAGALGDALARRLGEADPPQFALVMAERQSGWLQEHTMGALRARLDARLRAADRHGRYRIYYPYQPGLDGCINVHSKLAIFDDRLLVLGSANFNNRSMGLDTESCIALEAEADSPAAAAIARLRHRLLAEHLDAEAGAVAAAERQAGLLGAIERLRGDGRSLRALKLDARAASEPLLPAEIAVDPEGPLEPDALIAEVAAADDGRRARRRIAAAGAAALLIGALAAVWFATPLREWADVPRLVGAMNRFGDSPLAPLVLAAAYVVGGLLMFPVNVLIAVTVIVFGPLLGVAYSLAGSLLEAALLYEIGRRLPLDRLRGRYAAPMRRLAARLARRGVLAVTLLRIVPVAPYGLVNLLAGAARIGRRDYLLGTAAGMLPGIVVNAVFVDRLVAAVRAPGPLTYALLALAAAALAGLAALLHRHVGRSAAE